MTLLQVARDFSIFKYMLTRECSRIVVCSAVDAANGITSGSVSFVHGVRWNGARLDEYMLEGGQPELNGVPDTARFVDDLGVAVGKFVSEHWFVSIPSPVLKLVAWVEEPGESGHYGFWLVELPDSEAGRKGLVKESPAKSAQLYLVGNGR